MDGSSKPGIITDIQIDAKNHDRIIKVMPVKEFYCDTNIPQLKQGQEITVEKIKDRGFKPPIIEISQQGNIRVKYYGLYYDGMNASKNHNRHKHRFYQENGIELSGRIPAINFIDKNKLKEEVCIGGASPDGNPTEWYQDLSNIQKGSFIYFEVFNKQITHIGKNFQFKALFLHEDTVPKENSECKNINLLCPRCSMFGMTDKTDNQNRDAIGFKGRFKSSALVSSVEFNNEKEDKKHYPSLNQNITLKKRMDENNKQITYQTLLPISLSPRPNKRDVTGYFDKTTGFINGAKTYKHGSLASADNINGVDNLPSGDEYSHSLRNFAQVCEKGLQFTGTVGAENCPVEEISALLTLLHTPIANHGFKIGLGKAFGMGSIESRINKIWIRGKDYSWYPFNSLDNFSEELPQEIKTALQKIKTETEGLKIVLQKIGNLLIKEGNKMDVPNKTLKYPEPGLYYWKEFFPQNSIVQKR